MDSFFLRFYCETGFVVSSESEVDVFTRIFQASFSPAVLLFQHNSQVSLLPNSRFFTHVHIVIVEKLIHECIVCN